MPINPVERSKENVIARRRIQRQRCTGTIVWNINITTSVELILKTITIIIFIEETFSYDVFLKKGAQMPSERQAWYFNVLAEVENYTAKKVKELETLCKIYSGFAETWIKKG